MNLKYAHHRINALIIDHNRISVIYNKRHTNFTGTSRDNLRNAICQNFCQ